MKLTQRGNSKLNNTWMFNLPATKAVCGRECPGCYAIREQTRFPAVLTARESRFTAASQPTFAADIIAELSRARNLPKYYRIHASGEFFSQAYLDSWQQIAEAYPSVIFYAYTKRKDDFDFEAVSALPNFVLIDSLHFGKINYGPLSSAPANAFVCPHSATITCGDSCTYCMTKEAQDNGVYFIKH